MDGAAINVVRTNQLLNALGQARMQRIAADLELVHLEQDMVLFESGTLVSNVYFPIGSLVALMVPIRLDRWVEVGVIGSTGAVGLCVVLGGTTAHYRAFVLRAGPALRMSLAAYRHSVDQIPVLSPLLLRYVDAFLVQMSQTAACNGHHAFPQRLARWLLYSRDLLGSDELPFSQARIAAALSVRLATVSEAIGSLKATGVISAGKRSLRLVDGASLEALCCACYGIIRRSHAQLTEEYRALAARS